MVQRRNFLGATVGLLAAAATGFWGLLSSQASDDGEVKPPLRELASDRFTDVTRDVRRLLLYKTHEGKPVLTNCWLATFKDGNTLVFQCTGDVKVVVKDRTRALATCISLTNEELLFAPAEEVAALS